jgi:polyhydroxyalkanoic acid synthase PhaR subunit
MAEESKARKPMDPMDFWRHWSETSTKMWSNMLDEGKGTFIDPYGLYQPWLKSLEAALEQVKNSSQGTNDPKEVWHQWYEATTGAMTKAAELGGDPLGITAQWLEVMEENRAKILAEGTIPADPFTFFKQWFDASSETWSKVVGDIIGDEKFVENASQLMESYTSYYMVTRRANEDYFRNLQLPTRSDLARVAEIIVALEEKVDRIDEAFDDIEDGSSQLATRGSLADLEGRLSRVEKKLDTLSSVLEKLEVVEKLVKHTDQIEKKLDKALEAFAKAETKHASAAKNTDVVPGRRATRKNASNPKANSSSKVEV